MNTAVSVVIPSYNGSRFIGESLQSIFEQTRRPTEIVVVDDASTDGTPELVSAVARDAPIPVRLDRLHANSGGPASPLNRGVETACGTIIVTLDQDDLMPPERIAWQARLLEQHPTCPLVFGLYRLISPAGEIETAPKLSVADVLAGRHESVGEDQFLLDARDLYRRLILERNYVHGASNMAFHKATWHRLGGFATKYRVVWDCEFACGSCRLGSIGFVGRVVQHHRLHDRNLSRSELLTHREMLALRLEHIRRPLLDVDLTGAELELAYMYLGLGYWEARNGRLGSSLRAYAQALKLGASRRGTLSGVLKAIPHAALARLSGRRSNRKFTS